MVDTNYYVSETDLAQLLKKSGLPADFQNLFSRDYASVKRSIGGSADDVASLDQRVTDSEADITSLSISFSSLQATVTSLSGSLGSLQTNYNAHASSTSEHGAGGKIVGTNDFATLTVGGTVKLAAALVDQAASTVNVAATPNAAGVGYLQADAATWVTLLNELKSDLNALVVDHNSLRAKLNSMLASERAALQRAT